MSPGVLAVLLSSALLALAVGGPWLLRQAAPALTRVPRLAVALLSGSILVCLGALLAIGPVLAWSWSGPSLLPGRAAEVCQRCLAAANPFTEPATQTSIPAVVLLAASVVVAVALAVGVGYQLRQRSVQSRQAATALLERAEPGRLHGIDVQLVPAGRPFALTFPQRHGGIMVSSAALDVLDEGELAAVLAHEATHLRQRHHAVSVVVESVAKYLRWVPLVRATADALPHYLEICADQHAQRTVGTTALVSALVKLGEQKQDANEHEHLQTGALHAAGPQRIRQLVVPPVGLAGALPAVAITGALVALAIVSTTVHLPYASAALTGC